MEKIEFKILEEHMQKSLNVLQEDFDKIHAGRVSTALFKSIFMMRENCGKTSLIEVGLIRVVNANTLAIKPFDPSEIHLIEKTIRNSNLGANVGIMDDEVRAIFPALTLERRKEFVKMISTYSVNTKNALRAIRHDFIKENKKSSKEEEIKFEKEVQKIIDKFNIKIDEMTHNKQDEIMKI